MKPQPIFIQALWRTGSTYLWGKFRTQDYLRCYFEPLHESLYRKTKEQLQSDFERASSKFGHDAVRNNYYAEFPLRKDGGAVGFEPRFSLEKYALEPNEDDKALQAYIGNLITYANDNRQTPVLQFNRGALRGKWMQRCFSGKHVYLSRNPNDMLASYQSKGYYIPSYLAIIGQNASHPLFAQAAAHFKVAFYNAEKPSEAGERYKMQDLRIHYYRLARSLSEQDKKDLVAFFWTLGLAHATSYADMLIDTDRIIQGEGKTLPEMFQDLTGMNYDFSDLKIKTSGIPTIEVSEQMKDIIRNAIKILSPDWSTFCDEALSKNADQQLQSMFGAHYG